MDIFIGILTLGFLGLIAWFLWRLQTLLHQHTVEHVRMTKRTYVRKGDKFVPATAEEEAEIAKLTEEARTLLREVHGMLDEVHEEIATALRCEDLRPKE